MYNYKLDLQKYDDLGLLNNSYLSVQMLSSSWKRIPKADLITSFLITFLLDIHELDLRLAIPRSEMNFMGTEIFGLIIISRLFFLQLYCFRVYRI